MSELFSESQWQVWLPLGAVVVAALAFMLRRMERLREQRLARVVDAALASRLLPGYDARVRRPLFWLTVLGAAALVLALLQPRWGQGWVDVAKTSRDIMIVLDTSESMNAANPRPSRLVRARQKIQALMERCPGDRFGLIAFSGAASLQCPLTLDHAYLRAVLDAVDTDTLSAEGTDIAAALREAYDAFKDDAERSGEAGKGSRAILLISDGEQVTGDAEKAAKDAAAIADLFVLAIGTPEGATVSQPTWKQREGQQGEAQAAHHSKLDENTLRAVVQNDDAYVPMSAGNDDVDRMHRELDRVSARAVASGVRNRMINRYQWPLAFAIACFAGEGVWLAFMPRIRAWRLRRDARKTPEPNHA